MSAFDDAVQKIRASPPSRGRFGFRHYANGMDPNYSGPKYGKSTVMDAFYRAGQLDRRATNPATEGNVVTSKEIVEYGAPEEQDNENLS